jgi:hypothetical protein
MQDLLLQQADLLDQTNKEQDKARCWLSGSKNPQWPGID